MLSYVTDNVFQFQDAIPGSCLLHVRWKKDDGEIVRWKENVNTVMSSSKQRERRNTVVAWEEERQRREKETVRQEQES